MPRIDAEKSFRARRAIRWLSSPRFLIPLAASGVAGVFAGERTQSLYEHYDHMRNQVPTLFHMPFSVQWGVIMGLGVWLVLLTVLEVAAHRSTRDNIKTNNLPPNRIDILKFAKRAGKINDNGKVLGTNLRSALKAKDYSRVLRLISQIGTEVGVLHQELIDRAGQAAGQLTLSSILGREPQTLGLPLVQRETEINNVRDILGLAFPHLPATERQVVVELMGRLDNNLANEKARAAAAVPPPLPGNPFAGIGGVSVPPPPPSFQLAPGADPTMLSSSPPPPRATVVPTTPGSAASIPSPSAVASPTPAPSGPPVVLVPPPPPPKKEPSVIIKAGRRVGRALGMKRFQLPLPSAGGKPAGAPPRRLPISDPEFDRAFQAVKQAQEAGGDKEKALQILEELKKKNKLNPQQLIIADDYIGKLQSYLKTEKEMLDTPDPALELQLRTYLQQLNAAAKQKGDELSVAIVAGQGGISNDEATVVIQGVDQQIQQRWLELQTLLAGETADSINETKAIMAGELWESAPTVNIDQKLAVAFAALIKRAKPVDPTGLGMIERFFQEGRFKIVLTILEKKSIIRQLRIAENDPRYREFLLLLESYTSGSGVI